MRSGGEDEHLDFEVDHDEVVGSPVRRRATPVSLPRDDSDDEHDLDGQYVFTGADKLDFIPSSQYGEQKFDEGADVVLSEGQHIYVSACLRDDPKFMANAADVLPEKGVIVDRDAHVCCEKDVVDSSKTGADDGVIPPNRCRLS